MDAEGVMLGRNTKPTLGGTVRVGITRLEQIKLLKDLSSVTDEFGTLICEGNATVCTVEDGNSQFLLGVFNGG